MLSKFL